MESITTQRVVLSTGNDNESSFVVEDEGGNEILPGRGPADETLREEGTRKLIQSLNRVIDI